MIKLITIFECEKLTMASHVTVLLASSEHAELPTSMFGMEDVKQRNKPLSRIRDVGFS